MKNGKKYPSDAVRSAKGATMRHYNNSKLAKLYYSNAHAQSKKTAKQPAYLQLNKSILIRGNEQIGRDVANLLLTTPTIYVVY